MARWTSEAQITKQLIFQLQYDELNSMESDSMTTLTVTVKGQVTLKRDLLHHLGIKPGEKVDFDKLPNGELRIRAARPTGTIDGFIGLLAGKSNKVLSIEEMNEIAAAGWAGEK